MEASGDHHAIAPVTLCNQIHDYDDDEEEEEDDDDDDGEVRAMMAIMMVVVMVDPCQLR